jgi:hypothetical protein
MKHNENIECLLAMVSLYRKHAFDQESALEERKI